MPDTSLVLVYFEPVRTKLKWGVLGTSRIGMKVLPALASAKDSEIISIASRHSEKAKSAAAQFRIPKYYGSYEELLGDSEINAIYLPLPNALHCEWIKKAAMAGKHILCEKPMGVNASEVEDAIRFCKNQNVLLMDGFMWPHHPRTTIVRTLIESKEVGEIRHIETNFTFPLERPHTDIRRSPEMGGGSLYDVGCYCVRAILWGLGKMPNKLYAMAHFEEGIDVQMSALLEFEGNQTASFTCGFRSSYQGDLRIMGSKGVMFIPKLWHSPEIPVIEIYDRGELLKRISTQQTDSIKAMIETFVKAFQEGEEHLPDTHLALQTAKTIDLLYASARSGRALEFNPSPRD